MRTDPVILIPLKDAAAICNMKPQLFRDLVAQGAIVPAQPSDGNGRGHTHFFSAAQVYGLAHICALYRNCSQVRRSFIIDHMARFDKMPWAALEHALALRNDDWTEESWAKHFKTPASPTDFEWDGTCSPPDLEETLAAVRSFIRLRKVILARLGAGRITEARPARMSGKLFKIGE